MSRACARVRAAGAALAAAWCLCAGQSAAAIIGSCTIMIGQAGTLKNNAQISILGSKQNGGSPASVSLDANSLLCSLLNLLDCYSVSVVAPASFLSAPNGGSTNVTFATSYRLDGGADTAGTITTRLTNGDHDLLVDLTASRTGTVFPAGEYQAQATVRCE